MAEQPYKPLILEEFLPYRLSLLSNTVSGAIAALYADKFAISMTEWRIMALLGEHPRISADELCRRTRIEKSVVSRAVARLLERHLLLRETDVADRRRSILELSTTGQEIYAEIAPVALELEQRLVARLDVEERRALDALLAKLQAGAEALAAENTKPPAGDR